MGDHFMTSMLNDKFAAESATAWNLSQFLNFRLLLCFSAFVVLYLSFLIILPGIREKRYVTFITLSLQMLIGALIIGSIILPYWKVGEVRIQGLLHTNSRKKVQVDVGIWMGLRSFNITLKYIPSANFSFEALPKTKTMYRGLNLNERFVLGDIKAMALELQRSHENGAPYPILKVLEYFSLSQGAFAWGHHFRNAGHYTNAMLWLSFAFWLLQGLLLALLPHHFSKTGVLCGAFALISDLLYINLAPSDLNIPFPGPDGSTTFLRLHYGACFYMSLIAGSLAISYGLILSILQFLRLYTLTTFLSSCLDDTVGVKCRYGGKNYKGKTIESLGGSSSTSSSSASTINRTNNLFRKDGPNQNKISPALSLTSISSSSGKNSALTENSKSLDLLRRRTLEKLASQESPPTIQIGRCLPDDGAFQSSSISVYSLESNDTCRMTDDDDEGCNNQRNLRGRDKQKKGINHSHPSSYTSQNNLPSVIHNSHA